MHKVRPVKEPTASTFVFHHSPVAWRLGLIHHPRLSAWMLPGGHVEPDENAAEAALREVREETGLTVRLLPGPAVPLPTGFPHGAVPAPWWVVELTAAPDRHTPAPHVHIDHLYVAVADTEVPAGDTGFSRPVTGRQRVSRRRRPQAWPMIEPTRSPPPLPRKRPRPHHAHPDTRTTTRFRGNITDRGSPTSHHALLPLPQKRNRRPGRGLGDVVDVALSCDDTHPPRGLRAGAFPLMTRVVVTVGLVATGAALRRPVGDGCRWPE